MNLLNILGDRCLEVCFRITVKQHHSNLILESIQQAIGQSVLKVAGSYCGSMPVPEAFLVYLIMAWGKKLKNTKYDQTHYTVIT
jgi:hypothetical protein